MDGRIQTSLEEVHTAAESATALSSLQYTELLDLHNDVVGTDSSAGCQMQDGD